MAATKNKSEKQCVIILGPPGSGKGTQGELLTEKFNLYYLETSKILEDAFNSAKKNESVAAGGKKYNLLDEKKLWETGVLCSPPFVTYLVLQKVKDLHSQGKSLLLSGSPRTVYEGEAVVPLLKKLYGLKNIKVVLLEIKPEETIFRNTHRRICELMRHPIIYSENTKNLKICPLDGSKLLQRKGLDTAESIKVRLKEYKERTFPLVELFKKEKLFVKHINGSPAPAVVFENILKNFDK